MKNCNLKFSGLLPFCTTCQLAKSHKLPFVMSNSRAMKPFDLIHSDLWGPSPISSITSVKYFRLFIDDNTRFTWLYLLNTKDETFSYFLKFKNLVETQFNSKIKAVQTDWGGEYRPIKPFLENLGILHRHPCPYTPEQNGRVERKNRDVVEKGLSVLAHSRVPLAYWPYAFQTAAYLINRLPTPVLHNQTPFELLYQKPPSYNSIRVFGCACFPFLRPLNKHKLQFRSLECVLLGFSS